MRFTNMLVLSLLAYGAFLPAEAQFVIGNVPQQPPEVQVWHMQQAVNLDDTGAGNVHLAVEIPPDHHGYLDKGDEGFYLPLAITFAPLDAYQARVTLLSRPRGTRDDKAQATVLRGQGEFVFHLESAAASWPSGAALSATLHYQICNDLTNICYPPRTADVPIRVTGASTGPSTQLQPQPPAVSSLTLRERITALFQRYMTNIFLALGLVFVAGLVASATPCVYPVIPITAALLMARGAGRSRRGHLHAVVYFIGMVCFYTLLGGFAATTGTALSALMTSAWVNLGFAMVFAYLGLSMLGLYEFQILSVLTEKLDTAASHWSGLTGTFLMGSTAGLVVSPCVGPVVGAILLDITGQAAAASATNTSVPVIGRGLTLMTGFGMGLGFPFLIVGLLSNRLPQSGNWLTKVKYVLGLPILYFAYTYYSKGMETAGVPGHVAHAMLLGIVAIVVAVFMGAFQPPEMQPRRSTLLRRACGIVLLIVGTHFLYNGLGRSGILIDVPASPQAIATEPGSSLGSALTDSTQQRQTETHGNLDWLRDFGVAQQRARREQKPVFVDFYATWCANCKAFNRLTVDHALLNQALQQAVLVKIYDTDRIFPTFQQDQRFPELRGVGGQPFLPLFAIYSSQGTLVWKGQDYQAVRTMILQLDRAKSL